MNILLAEDDTDLRSILSQYLEINGYTVLQAENGKAGLDIFRNEHVDFCILDIMMPRKDGYVLCNELKADQETRDIPVVLLTAVGEAVPSTRYSHADGMSTEADDYIAKPIDTENLWEIVNSLLS